MRSIPVVVPGIKRILFAEGKTSEEAFNSFMEKYGGEVTRMMNVRDWVDRKWTLWEAQLKARIAKLFIEAEEAEGKESEGAMFF